MLQARRCSSLGHSGSQKLFYVPLNVPLNIMCQRLAWSRNVTLKCIIESQNNVCSGTGDPHFTTFDGVRIHFQDICTYTLVKPCVQGNIFYRSGIEPWFPTFSFVIWHFPRNMVGLQLDKSLKRPIQYFSYCKMLIKSLISNGETCRLASNDEFLFLQTHSRSRWFARLYCLCWFGTQRLQNPRLFC